MTKSEMKDQKGLFFYTLRLRNKDVSKCHSMGIKIKMGVEQLSSYLIPRDLARFKKVTIISSFPLLSQSILLYNLWYMRACPVRKLQNP